MGIVTDLAVKTSWNVASGFKNTFTITVTEGGSAYSLASRAFSLQIRKIGSETNFVNLTEGSGITNGGATGILTIVLTAAQSATLGNENYLWQLTCITDETRWLSGTVEATTGVYDGDTATALSASVSLTGTALTLAITLASTTASGISFTPAANIAATNVQAAIEEVVSDLTTIANAKVADAINDGTTTIAPSQNAVFDALALKAPLASPTFTGNPEAPTQTQADNSTKLATTAYVDTGLATKQASLGYTPSRRILYKNQIASSLTGTTAETVMDSVLVAAGTFAANDLVFLRAHFTKTGTAGILTAKFRINTQANGAVIAGSTQMSNSATTGGTNVWYGLERYMYFKNSVSSIMVIDSANNYTFDLSQVTVAKTTLTNNFAAAQYIFITGQLGSAADTLTLEAWTIEIIRT